MYKVKEEGSYNMYMLNAQMNKRIDWIDISKGIGVILLVIGHIAQYSLRDSKLDLFISYAVVLFLVRIYV